MDIIEKLSSLGLQLPETPVPVGNYLPAKRVGNLVFTSGQTARIGGVRRYVGKVGLEVSDGDAYLSARDAALNCVACAGGVAGGVDRIRDVVKITGFVNCVDGYDRQPAVINGARKRQSESIRRWQPWPRSTGPRSDKHSLISPA